METESITLAPAAGAGIGKMIADELLSRPGFVTRMCDALDNGLTATRRTWDSGSKQWVEEPDTRSQLQAFFGCVAHMEGEPVKRVFHQHSSTGHIDPLEALRASPELRDAARRELEKAEWRESGRKREKRVSAALEVD